jgi:aminopeptidase-like protein
MNSADSIKCSQDDQVGGDLYRLIERLYPICRSITGDGVRESLKIIREFIPLDIKEVPSGTEVFDWRVPDEWNIRDAWIKNSRGEKVVDFQNLNLHVLNYSVPVHKTVKLDELKEHLHTLPEYPDWIPYRTSYHDRNWGFCLSHNQLLDLPEDDYEVKVDSTLEPGHLTYGEYLIKGTSTQEVLISCHICHPSLCNDNLSGIAVATFVAMALSKSRLKYSYRFLFIPGTIGSITWLSLNEEKAKNIKHGLVLSLLGDSGKFNYKKSRRGDTEIDRLVTSHLKREYDKYGIIDFYPYGYDERQFCSPGFNLPVGRLSRSPHGEFPQYHTSADNLDFVKAESLAQSYELLCSLIQELECAEKYLNLSPKCEPQLGKRGLFKKIGGQSNAKETQMALLWVLNLSDGEHSLRDISERSGLQSNIIREAVDALVNVDLLKPLTPTRSQEERESNR